MPATVQDDTPVNEQIVEQVEHLCLWPASTQLFQAALADQNPTRLAQRLPRRAKQTLNQLDPVTVLLGKSELIYHGAQRQTNGKENVRTMSPSFKAGEECVY